jgi:DNA-binding FadR family transcriptional regulator
MRKAAKFQGVIEVRGLLGATLEQLGTRIVSGDWPPGEVIPKEADLVAEFDVSRSVIREAFRILGAKGMIRSRTSEGTRVTPRGEWRLLDPDVIDWRIKAGDTQSLLEDLLAVRLVLEPGIAYEAARRATDADRAAVRAAWQAKVDTFHQTAGSHEEKRAAFIETDLGFHRAILSVVGSELLEQLFTVIDAALRLLLDLQMRARGYTLQMIGMEESHALHERVFDAFCAGDPLQTEAAMRTLIGRAIDDAHAGFDLLKDEGDKR